MIMPTNLSPSAAPVHRIPRVDSGNPRIIREMTSHVWDAFSSILAPFARRPAWTYEVTRSEATIRMSWVVKAVIRCHELLRLARRDEPQNYAAIAQRVRVFWRTCEAESFAGIEPLNPAALAPMVLGAIHQASDCISALAQVQHEDTEGNLGLLRLEAMAARDRLDEVIDLASQRLAQVHVPMRAAGGGR